MYPRLFGHPYLNTFGLCIVIGLVLCFVVGRCYARVKGAQAGWADFVEFNAYFAIAVGGGVSILAQSLFFYLQNPAAGFRLSPSSTYISGLIGGIASFLLGYFVYGRRRFGPRIVEVVPIVPVCITIAHAFGRLGCFFAGCCYGRDTQSMLGVVFPGLGRPVYPTQLFESAFLFLLFGILAWLVFRRNFYQGMSVYLFAYGVFRFLIEFIRGDDRGVLLGGLSPSQTLSLVMIAAAGVLWFVMERMVRDYRANTVLQNKMAI